MLLFGEHDNDRKAIRELMVALCPRLEGRIKLLRELPAFDRDVDRLKRAKQVDRITRAVAAASIPTAILSVFVHKDCDRIEPAHEELARDIEEQLAVLPCTVHAVVPAWELEAWWFLWPEAVAGVNDGWAVPQKYRGVQVGRIEHAKETFRREIRTFGGGTSREYRESDSIRIAAKVRELGIVSEPRAQSASFTRFRQSTDTCCRNS